MSTAYMEIETYIREHPGISTPEIYWAFGLYGITAAQRLYKDNILRSKYVVEYYHYAHVMTPRSAYDSDGYRSRYEREEEMT